MADVLVKNLQETIAELKSEAKLISREITSANFEKKQALLEKDNAKISLDSIQGEYRNLLEGCQNKKKEIEELNFSFVKKQKDFKDKIEESQKLYEKEKKDKTKELSRLNSWILEAKNEEQEYIKKLEFINEKISQHKEKFENVLKLENQILDLEKNNEVLRKENEGIIIIRQREIELSHKKIEEIKNEISQLELEMEYARNKKHGVENECERKKGDLDIYYRRVKKAWDIVFPNRNMPMPE